MSTSALTPLTGPQCYMLWRVAQHKYGWTHVSRFGGGLQVADALVRRGLVDWGRNGRDHHDTRVQATDAGRVEIERRWPISPFVLDTYENPEGGWDPPEGRPAAARCELCRGLGWILDCNDLGKPGPRMVELQPCLIPDCEVSGQEIRSLNFPTGPFTHVALHPVTSVVMSVSADQKGVS